MENTMKYYELELNGETIKLRLTSNDSITIERKTGVKLLDYIQDYSMTTIITLLMYMRRSSIPNFSEKDATDLYDKFIDAGYTLKDILYDVLFEALAVSGFLSKEELQTIKNKMKGNSKKQQEMIEDIMEA